MRTIFASAHVRRWVLRVTVFVLMVLGAVKLVESLYSSQREVVVRLRTPQEEYAPGDRIDLIFEFYAPCPQRIALDKKGRPEIHLYLHPADKLVSARGPSFSQEKKRVQFQEIDPQQPFTYVVRGYISRDKKTGKVIFDFFEYGHFEMQKLEFFSVSGEWCLHRVPRVLGGRRITNEVPLILRSRSPLEQSLPIEM
ncbi:MAG: hypothetical protein GF333_01210 [Candidatus Omnitrophica bacterium]|nr:hypothetical protein [Candidatus Omnitrophota bacterium]